MADTFCLKSFLINFAAMLLVAAVFITALPHAVEAAEKKIVVIGSSRIYNNVTNARNSAVAEGLLSAVESATLEMLPKESLKSEFETISNRLYDNRRTFIQDYQVLEEVNTDKYYRVLIRTTISVDKIQTMFNELGITMATRALPKTLFLVAEKHADDLSFDYWWHSRGGTFEHNTAVKPMKQVFRKQGFPIINHRDLAKDEILSELDLSAGLTAAEATMLGRRTEADIVVFGKAEAAEARNKRGGDTKTFRGNTSLTAVDVNTEAIIATTEQIGTAANRQTRDGSRQALSNVGYRTGKILAEKISKAWHQQAQQSGTLEIRVKGEGDILPKLVSFRKTLRQIEGITALQTTERSRNAAVLSIKYEGSPRGLADKILLTQFDGFGVNISDMMENRINIELLSEQSITESEINSP